MVKLISNYKHFHAIKSIEIYKNYTNVLNENNDIFCRIITVKYHKWFQIM